MYHSRRNCDYGPGLADPLNHGNILVLWYIVGTPHRAVKLG